MLCDLLLAVTLPSVRVQGLAVPLCLQLVCPWHPPHPLLRGCLKPCGNPSINQHFAMVLCSPHSPWHLHWLCSGWDTATSSCFFQPSPTLLCHFMSLADRAVSSHDLRKQKSDTVHDIVIFQNPEHQNSWSEFTIHQAFVGPGIML